MSIEIDIASAKAVNEHFPASINRVGGVNDCLSRLKASVDSRILDRQDLRARLNNAQRAVDSLEKDLLLLHRTIAQNINSYEETEKRVKLRIKNIPDKPRK